MCAKRCLNMTGPLTGTRRHRRRFTNDSALQTRCCVLTLSTFSLHDRVTWACAGRATHWQQDDWVTAQGMTDKSRLPGRNEDTSFSWRQPPGRETYIARNLVSGGYKMLVNVSPYQAHSW